MPIGTYLKNIQPHLSSKWMSPHVFQRKKQKNLHRSLAQTGPCHQSQGWRKTFFLPKDRGKRKKQEYPPHALSEYYAIDKTFFPPFAKGGQGPTM